MQDKSKIIKIINDNNCIHIYVYVIDSCNYSCFYCYNQNLYNRTNIKIDFNILLKYLIYIHKILDKHIYLSLLGGEPTLHPGLLEFCEKIYNNYSFISLECFSNFSQKINLYEKLLKFNVFMILSYHSKNLVFFNKLDELFNKSNKYKHNCHINIMYEPQISKFTIKKYLFYKDICNVELNKIKFNNNFKQTKTYTYTIDEENDYNKYLKNDNLKNIKCITNNNQLVYYSFNQICDIQKHSFKYWLCTAGINSQYIHINGNIYKCQSAFNFNHIIGNICQSEFLIQQMLSKCKQHICQYDTCDCEVDISKIKIFKN